MLGTLLAFAQKLRGYWKSQNDRVYAFADQLLYGGGNMLATVLLGRTLPAEDFAAFVTAVAVYFVIYGFHRALLVMPFLLSAKETVDERTKSQWVWLALISSLTLFALMLLVALGMRQMGFADFAFRTAIFASLQAPALLLQEFGKRWLYQHGKGAGVVASSAVSLLGILAGITMISLGILPPAYASAVMGAAAIAAAVMQFCVLPPQAVLPSASAMWRLLAPRLAFGLWQSATHIPYVIYNNGFPLLLAKEGSPLAVASFAALRNLLAPTYSLISAVDSTDKVRAVKAMREHGVHAAFASTQGTRNVLLLLGTPFIVLVAASGPWLQNFVYGGRYNNPAELTVLAVYCFFLMINQPFETFLTVNQFGGALFASRAVSALVTLAATTVLVPRFGLMGAVCALLMAQIINCALLALNSRVCLRAEQPQEQDAPR